MYNASVFRLSIADHLGCSRLIDQGMTLALYIYIHDLRHFGPCPLVVSMLPRRHVQNIQLSSSAAPKKHTLESREHPGNSLYNHTKD